MSTIRTIKEYIRHNLLQDTTLEEHNAVHLHLATLEPIQMGNYVVNGIDGVCIAEFSNADQEPKYDGFYDECRVALHQYFLNPSNLTCKVKFIYYIGWMIYKGINPVFVVIDHYNSMK